jgi:hypothetical protein
MNRTFRLYLGLTLLLAICAALAAAQAPAKRPRSRALPPPAVAPANQAAQPPVAVMARKPATGGNAVMPASAYSTVPVKKTAAGEQFFIVASLDLQQKQLLLKYPTEVTLLVKTTDQTKFVDDSEKPMKLSDLRAGDTVWLTSSGSGSDTTATKVRKGEMTVADLHHYYLDYAEIK